MENDTPRTDAEVGYAMTNMGILKTDTLYADANGPFVHAEFARQLERELAALKATRKSRDEYIASLEAQLRNK